ncbi:MAG TPA: SDR family oxidoreductase [Gammaproteobacteria bacterium]|nr:SDR family oxidoreductase [Gammaproteobacteria bacterium]
MQQREEVGRRREAEPSLDGKVAVVTGGGSGLGAAICRVLAAAGANVVVADVDARGAEQTAASIGGTARAETLDVRDEEGAASSLARVAAEQGRLDVLVNNAGVDVTKSIMEMSVAEWDRVIAVNLRGPFVLAKLAFERMRGAGGGHIVNIVSTAARRAWANAAAYHASKWGLLGLSHAMHVEGREHGIRVTALIAGGMRTPFLLDRFPDIDRNVLQDPENVAEAVRFVLMQPRGTVIPELMVVPERETSWP